MGIIHFILHCVIKSVIAEKEKHFYLTPETTIKQ